MKWYKPPGVDLIPAELTQAGGEILRSEIHKLIKLIHNKEELPHCGNSQLWWYLSTETAMKLIVVIIGAHHCCRLSTKFYQTFFSVG
jgi:hypothetical protein